MDKLLIRYQVVNSWLLLLKSWNET